MRLFIVALCLALFVQPVLAQNSSFNAVVDIPREYESVQSGGTLLSSVKIVNLASESRADVVLEFDILDMHGNPILSKRETVALETTATIVRSFTLPSSLPSGVHVLRVTVHSANGAKAVASHSFTVSNAKDAVVSMALPFALCAIFLGGALMLFRSRLVARVQLSMRIREIISKRKRTVIHISIFLFVVFLSFILPIVKAETGADACGVLSAPNELFVLNQSLSSITTCITLAGENSTLDCRGFSIETTGAASSAVVVNASNTAVINCTLVAIDGRALFVSQASNVTVSFISATVQEGTGVFFENAHSSTLSHASVVSGGDFGYGFAFSSSSNITITNASSSVIESDGFSFTSSVNMRVVNSTSSSTGGHAYAFSSSSFNVIEHSSASATSGNGFYFSSSSFNTINYTNASSTSGNAFHFEFSSGGNAVYDSNGSSQSGAAFEFYDSSNNSVHRSRASSIDGQGLAFTSDNVPSGNALLSFVNASSENDAALLLTSSSGVSTQGVILFHGNLSAGSGGLNVQSSTAGNNSLLDSSFDASEIFFDDAESNLSIAWLVSVSAQASGLPVQGAIATLTSSLAETVFSHPTLANGSTPTFAVIERTLAQSEMSNASPFTLSVSASGYDTASSSVSINSSYDFSVTLTPTTTTTTTLAIPRGSGSSGGSAFIIPSESTTTTTTSTTTTTIVLIEPSTDALVEEQAPPRGKALFDIGASLSSHELSAKTPLLATISLLNIGSEGSTPATLYYEIRDERNTLVWREEETVLVETQKQYIKRLDVSSLAQGAYALTITLSYPGQEQPAQAVEGFRIRESNVSTLSLFTGSSILVFLIAFAVFVVATFSASRHGTTH